MVREGMRGDDQQQNHMFSYLSPEMRVRKDHPLRAIRNMVDEVLAQLSGRFDTMYARVGRPSIAPEKLLAGGPSLVNETLLRVARSLRFLQGAGGGWDHAA